MTTSKAVVLSEAPRETGLNAAMAADLFKAKEGDAASGESADGEAYILARVVRIEAADPAKDKKQLQALSDAIAQSIANDLVQQFEIALRGEYDVEIDHNIINALFNNADDQRSFAN